MWTLPESVCFRVTRFCNARCSFCLAPPDGEHPGTDVLLGRIDWLLDSGVRVVHFCGGEPTIHPGIAGLLEHVHSRGGKTRLTTNGILLPDELLKTFRRLRTDVKVSLHGDREFHNRIVGRRDAFDAAVQSLRRLVAAGVRPSVQTTLVAGCDSVVDWAVRFCCDHGVRRVNFLPFIPRGSGYDLRADFAFTPDARKALQAIIRDRRKAFAGRLDIKWLDFNSRPVPVVEADGRVVLEGATEAADRTLLIIKGSTSNLVGLRAS